MVHVPYRGAAPALNDIVAGHVDMMFDTIVTSSPLHRAGTARYWPSQAWSGRAPCRKVPTIAKLGLPNFRSITWFARGGAAGHAGGDRREAQQ